MKIIKYGNDEEIVFDNGNSLWDTYSQIWENFKRNKH